MGSKEEEEDVRQAILNLGIVELVEKIQLISREVATTGNISQSVAFRRTRQLFVDEFTLQLMHAEEKLKNPNKIRSNPLQDREKFCD